MLFAAAFLGSMSLAKSQQMVDLENLSLSADSFWNGSDNSGQFVANQLATFPNSFVDWGSGVTSWSGFAYSNKLDTVNQNYSNQYSCFAGQQTLNSTIFGISYNNADYSTYQIIPNTVSFSQTIKPTSMQVANNTYTALTIKNGNSYSKKFGGDSGNDPDWFKLTIVGFLDSIPTDTVEFYLADYRFSDNQQDYIVKDWQTVDLSSLGNVNQLSFSLSSSDTGSYGMNTPAYFCFDNIVYEHANFMNASSNEAFIVYPNPAKDKINFSKSVNDIHIYNMMGCKVYENHILINTLSISNLPSGYYTIKGTVENKTFISSFLKAE
jgi:hypothetical protein